MLLFVVKGGAAAVGGKDELYDMDEACNVPVDSARELPLAKLKLVAQDGRELDPAEILIAPSNAA